MAPLPPFRTGHMRHEQGFCTPVPGLELPFTILEGPEPGPTRLVTAGVHGAEFCSIEAALRLCRLEPAGLSGTLAVLPILIPTGFRARAITVMPEDGKTLNRMVPGRPDGTVSEQLVPWLVSAVDPQADATLDLHGGDLDESLRSFSLDPRVNTAVRSPFGSSYLPHAEQPAQRACRSTQGGASFDTPPSAAAQDEGGWSVETASKTLATVFGLAVAIEAAGEGTAINAAGKLGIPSVPAALCDGLWYPAVELDDTVEAGGVLGEIRDVFGRELATIRFETAGSILDRLTSLSVNRGEALPGVGTPLAATPPRAAA